MALQKQTVNLNFQSGLDTKNDPYQIAFENFLKLDNMVFTTPKMLQKRNGFADLTALPSIPGIFSYLCTYKDNLVAIGNGLISAYSTDEMAWIDPRASTSQFAFFPNQLSTTSLIRNNANQVSCDSAVAGNGLVCVVYASQQGEGNAQTFSYAIMDSVTGQASFAPTVISGVKAYPRVFVLGNYFIISYVGTSSNTLEYFSITTAAPFTVGSPTVITSSFNDSNIANGVPYDGYVAPQGTFLYFAWASTVPSIQIASLSTSLVLSSPSTVDTKGASVVAITQDGNTNGNIWVVYWLYASTNSYNVYASVVDPSFSSVLAPTVITSTSTVQGVSGPFYIGNITVVAQSGTAYICYDIIYYFGGVVSGGSATGLTNSYYPNSTTFCWVANQANSPVPAQVAGSPLYTMGLASKAFNAGASGFFVVVAYGSQSQPTYFVVNLDPSFPNCCAKIAYQNGGGYLSYGPGSAVGANTYNALPSATFNPDSLVGPYFAYLYKDFLAPVNKAVNQSFSSNSFAGIYTQNGINLATISFGSGVIAMEAANSLNVSGGFVWTYDGILSFENNFFLWPEIPFDEDGAYGGCVTNSNISESVTGCTVVEGSKFISTTLTDIGDVFIGMSVSDSTTSGNIPAGAYVTSVNYAAQTFFINVAATGSGASDTLLCAGSAPAETTYYSFIYQWTDNQGNIHRSAPSIPVSTSATPSGSEIVNTIAVPTLNLTYKTNVSIIGYRWSTSLPIFYQFTSIEQPTISETTLFTEPCVQINDGFSTAAISGNAILYTNGGVVEDINPPATHLMTLFDDRVWLVDDEDTNLLWFSKQIIEATPLEMSDLFTIYVAPTITGRGSSGPITAISAMDDKLILFKENDAIYYINGSGPDNTGANNQYSQPIFITSAVSCANPSSIVLIPDGIMFQSNKGIWLLGRDMSVSYIGSPVEAYNSQTITSATLIPGTTQVRFTFLGEGGDLEYGTWALVYDYFVKTWSTFSSGLYSPISSCIYNNLHTVLEEFVDQPVIQETPGTYLDEIRPVLMSFTTAWINLAGLQGYQRAYFFYLLGASSNGTSSIVLSLYKDYNSENIAQQDTFLPPSTNAGQPWRQRIFFGQDSVGASNQRSSSVQMQMQETQPVDEYGGNGFTISGLEFVIGVKKGYKTISASNTEG